MIRGHTRRLATLAGLALLTACSRTELLDQLERAKVTAKRVEHVRRQEVTVNGERRDGLLVEGEAVVRFDDMTVDSGAVLRFGIGVDEKVWQQPGDGVLFQVEWRIEEKRRTLFSRYVDPKNRPADRRWIDVEIPLDQVLSPEASTVTGSLSFKTSAGMRDDGENDRAGWSRPQIVHPLWPSRREADSRPNVLLISLDTLRADHVGVYGYERPTTPRIDAWARDAMVFTRATAPANSTLESHMTVLTGLAPDVHGVRSHDNQPGKGGIRPLDPRRVTLAELLQGAGYWTAGFVHSCYWLDHPFGFPQGFDNYTVSAHHAADRNAKEVFPALEHHRDLPLFLFAHYFDVHSDWKKLPYEVPAPFAADFLPPPNGTFNGCGNGLCASKYLGELNTSNKPLADRDLEYIRSLYDAGIAFTDRQIGTLLDKLKELDLYDRTLIILMGDHGEEFRDHGKFLHVQLYEEVVRVPLIISYPPLIKKGGRFDQPVSLMDLTATILEVTGIPPSRDIQGRSLLPALRLAAMPEEPAISISMGVYAMIKGQWKLIHNPLSRRSELYDLAADPKEQHDIFRGRPLIASRLLRELQQRIEDNRLRADTFTPPGAEVEKILPSEADAERLRNLGYLE